MIESISLGELAKHIGADLQGDASKQVNGIAPIQCAEKEQISFLSNGQYRKYLGTTKAVAVILTTEDLPECSVDALVVKNSYVAYAKAAQLFDPGLQVKSGIHPTVVLGENCQIDPSVSIGANTVLSDNVRLGANVVIGANCSIGNDCVIEAGSRLWPNVTLYHKVSIGQRSILHSGVVVGSDGFGIAKDGDQWLKVPQLGGVVIGHDVEIGANTTIDRGALDDTVLADGVKLDNQIQVAHNVTIGRNTAIAGCTGISGSVDIGADCLIGGGTCIAGHLSIADKVTITGMSGVYTTLDKAGVYSSGTGVQETRTWIKNVSRLRNLNEIARRVKALEKRIEKSTS